MYFVLSAFFVFFIFVGDDLKEIIIMDKLLNIGPETTNFSSESHNLDYEFDRQLDEVKPLVIKLADKNCKLYIWIF